MFRRDAESVPMKMTLSFSAPCTLSCLPGVVGAAEGCEVPGVLVGRSFFGLGVVLLLWCFFVGLGVFLLLSTWAFDAPGVPKDGFTVTAWSWTAIFLLWKK